MARKTVTVDRIEGRTAVLVDDRDEATIPASWLPSGAGEGAVLKLQLDADANAQESAAERIRRLQGQAKTRR